MKIPIEKCRDPWCDCDDCETYVEAWGMTCVASNLEVIKPELLHTLTTEENERQSKGIY